MFSGTLIIVTGIFKVPSVNFSTFAFNVIASFENVKSVIIFG